MADYFSQTVVQPFIPADAITPLELALLTHMYEHEAVDDAIYFRSANKFVADFGNYVANRQSKKFINTP